MAILQGSSSQHKPQMMYYQSASSQFILQTLIPCYRLRTIFYDDFMATILPCTIYSYTIFPASTLPSCTWKTHERNSSPNIWLELHEEDDKETSTKSLSPLVQWKASATKSKHKLSLHEVTPITQTSNSVGWGNGNYTHHAVHYFGLGTWQPYRIY